jgi:hypothetical protein
MREVRRGDIRNVDYAFKAKTYSWGIVSKAFPGNISPTDIDGTVEINGNFLAVEFKTIGQQVGRGQSLYFEQWLNRLKRHGVLLIAEHPPLNTITIPDELITLSVWWWEDTQSGVAKLSSFPINTADFRWWCEQWVLYASERPNSLIRALREKIGIYPSSTSHGFERVGGEICKPPFRVSVDAASVKKYPKFNLHHGIALAKLGEG